MPHPHYSDHYIMALTRYNAVGPIGPVDHSIWLSCWTEVKPFCSVCRTHA